jgi:hypothetical protein
MYQSAQENVDDREEYRLRIQKMDDPSLLRQGQAAKFMCSPQANHGQSARQRFVTHLEECRKECWMGKGLGRSNGAWSGPFPKVVSMSAINAVHIGITLAQM